MNPLHKNLNAREVAWFEVIKEANKALITAKDELEFRGSKVDGFALKKINEAIEYTDSVLKKRNIAAGQDVSLNVECNGHCRPTAMQYDPHCPIHGYTPDGTLK